MGNSSSKMDRPAVPVALPIGVFQEFSHHQEQMRLELEVQPCRAFKKQDDLKTVVRVSTDALSS